MAVVFRNGGRHDLIVQLERCRHGVRVVLPPSCRAFDVGEHQRSANCQTGIHSRHSACFRGASCSEATPEEEPLGRPTVLLAKRFNAVAATDYITANDPATSPGTKITDDLSAT